MRLDPEKDVYYPGGTITCEADGNPALQTDDYQWINLNDPNDITEGPVLTITADMMDTCRTFSFRCRACNEYLGEARCTILDAHFYVSGKPHTAHGLYFSC